VQICGRVNEAGLLSVEGIAQQRRSQQMMLKQLDRFMESCGSGSAIELGSQVLEDSKGLVPLPTKRLLFDGLALSHIEGWARTQRPAA
jgi:hypothetical protein